VTPGECREEVDRVLDARPVVIISQADLDARQRLVGQLEEMVAECAPALEQRARELLAAFDPPGAEALSMILEAFARCGKRDLVAALATAALTAPGSAEREPFVDLLEELGGSDAARALAQTLLHYDNDSDVNGFLRRRILRALATFGGDQLPAIEAALETEGADGGELVRAQAIDTIELLDARPAAPALVRRLEEDDDPGVVASAASVLADWGHRPAIAALEALAAADWVRENGRVRAAVEDALDELR
jgi:HEAT repeat protein